LDQGWTVAVCPYPGFTEANGEVFFPKILHVAVAQLRYLRGSASAIGILPSGIAAWGLSSGGWFAAMLGASSSNKFSEAGLLGTVGSPDLLSVPTNLCAVSGFYGSYSPWLVLQSRPEAIWSFFPAYKMMDPDTRNEEQFRKASVYTSNSTYLSKSEGAPPMFLSVGENDAILPPTQTTDLVKLLDELNIENEFIPVPGAGHADPKIYDNITILTKMFSFVSRSCQ